MNPNQAGRGEVADPVAEQERFVSTPVEQSRGGQEAMSDPDDRPRPRSVTWLKGNSWRCSNISCQARNSSILPRPCSKMLGRHKRVKSRSPNKNEIKKLEKESGRAIDLLVASTSNEVAKADERRVGELENKSCCSKNRSSGAGSSARSTNFSNSPSASSQSLMISALLAIWHSRNWCFG